MDAAAPRIRGYRILNRIGRGGMGEVFLAEDETLERRVAIKRIAAPLAGQGEARTRFLREARAMAGVEHRHVVRVYAFGEAEGQPYIVMEYVQGETLAARLHHATRLGVDEALRVAREVAEALEAAWARGIVHRDVKPANILLDREDHVKVADFGLARGADEVQRVVRSPRAAHALAQKLGVDVLVWGEALAFRGEVELAARLTRKDGALVESAGANETLPAAAPNAIATRRARASAVVDEVARIRPGR